MTRSNVYITLSNGKKFHFVIDGSSAPEQGYIVEKFLDPLLAINDGPKELMFIHEHSDSINELRTNASYRYIIDLRKKTVKFYEENYNYKTDKFQRGKDLTEERFIPYIKTLKQSEKQIIHQLK